MKTHESPVVVTARFHHDPERLWKAITDIDQMKHWYFEQLPDFRPLQGFKTSFAVQSGERTFTHQWQILEVIPEKKLRYSWKYKEYPGNSVLTMSLHPEADGTLLELSHRTLEDFPDGIPEFKRERCLMGWEYFINDRLSAYLNK